MHRLAAPPTIGTIAAVALYQSVRRARTRRVSRGEDRLFRVFNEAPDRLHAPAWAVMQSGSLAAVFLTGGVLAGAGRRRTAGVAVLTGVAVWGGVKLVKPLVDRGRPADLLDGVSVRGLPQTGLGYPSGHAALSMTLGVIVAPSARPMCFAAAASFAGLVGATRMYVGAHLPWDVAGGLALGVLSGSAARSIIDGWP